MKIKIAIPLLVRGWRIQVHPWETLRRWLLNRCAKCGRGFAWGEGAMTAQWDTPPTRWFRGQVGLYHAACFPSPLPGAKEPDGDGDGGEACR